MKIGTRLALQSTILSLTAIVMVLSVITYQLRRHAIEEARERASMILAEKQATIDYVTNHLKPAIEIFINREGRDKDYFDPAWMSAGYINRSLMRYFNADEFKDYYYKNATVNARNPANEANEDEAEFLSLVRRDSSITSKSTVTQIEGKPYFVHMQALATPFTDQCMRCHSTPERAPRDLVKIYGDQRSFNMKIGEIPSVLSLRIPLAKTYQYVDSLISNVAVLFATILLITFFIQWFLTRRAIVIPLRKISNKALSIAEDESKLGETIEIQGNSELADMAMIFSNMSMQLAMDRDKLHSYIHERTQELSETRSKYQVLFEKMGEGFALHEMIFNSSGLPVDYRFITVNPAFEEMTGLSRDQVTGRTVLELMPATEAYWIESAARVVRTGKADRFENYSNELGKYFEVVYFKVGQNQFAAIFRDVTAKKNAEEKQNELEENLKQAHKMEALGTLAGGIAHDFNNILSAVLGYAEMAKHDVSEQSPVHAKLNEISRAGNRAKELVEHILAFSRKSNKEKIPVRINLIVKEALSLLRATIPTTIDIRQNISRNCGMIMADPVEIHQVVMNLCTNAYQAMEQQGGVLEIVLDSRTLSGQDLAKEYSMIPGEYIRLMVSDTGHGIRPEHQQHIFDPYYTTKEIGQGTGMGLSVVHGIIRASGGLIRFESKVGKGSCFELFFPQIEQPFQEVTENESDDLKGDERVMVVDDEELLADMTKERLESLGYKVVSFASSTEALTAFSKAPDDFDMVITDQTMPGMTGDQIARRMLQIRPELPIILCTGYSSRIDREQALALGIKAFIMKPVDTSVLSQLIREVFEDTVSPMNKSS